MTECWLFYYCFIPVITCSASWQYRDISNTKDSLLSRLPSPVRLSCLLPASPPSVKMANVLLDFRASAGDSEPQSRPVLIIGQPANLQQVSWSQIKGKLQPVVSKEVAS